MTAERDTAVAAVASIRHRQKTTRSNAGIYVAHDKLDALIDRWGRLEASFADRPSALWTFHSTDSGRIVFAAASSPTVVLFGRRGTFEMVDGTLDIHSTKHNDNYGGS